ncbi:MAG: protein kinase [Bdellovibrionales bacterium]|nr:protein kinase [Bdellovibrionales bacterium]
MGSGQTDKDPLAGKLIDGKYRIIERVGGGGMGVVYKATHELMGRTVAMKLLHRHLMTGEEDAEFLERFRREAQASARMEHPNAVTIHDFGIYDDYPYLVMQYVEGQTLRQLIRAEGALEVRRVLDIMMQVCGAVAEAHSLNIIHRDLKPDNIMVSPRPDGRERATVLDFGIAKMIGADSENTAVTKTGNIVGTPQYMAPEQVKGSAALDARSDIYSIGVILYEMCAGKVPFDSDSAVGLMMKHLHEQPLPFAQLVPPLEIPAELERIVLQALEKPPEKRQQSLAELGTQLQEAALLHAPELGTGSFPRAIGGAQSTLGVAGTIATEAIAEPSAPPREPGARSIPIAALVGALLLGGILWFLFASDSEPERSAQLSSSPEQMPTQTPPPTPTPEPDRTPTEASSEPKLPTARALDKAAKQTFAAAQAAKEAKAWENAERLYKEVLLDEPQYAPAYHALGDVYLSLERLSDAAVMFNRATELSPDDAAGFSKLGYAYDQLGRPEEAIEAYQATIRLKPEYALAYNNLGFTYLKTGQLDKAEEAFKRCLRLDSTYARAFFNLAELYQRRGDWERAILAHRGGVQADPNNAAAVFALGQAYEKVGKRQDAVAAYRRTLEIDDTFSTAKERLSALTDR